MQYENNESMDTDTERILCEVFHLSKERAAKGAIIYKDIIAHARKYNSTQANFNGFQEELSITLVFDLDKVDTSHLG